MIGMLSCAMLNLIANITTREAKDRKQVSFVVYILAIIFLLKIIFG